MRLRLSCTSLVESRLLKGSAPLFAQYARQFRRQVRRRGRWLIGAILDEYAAEPVTAERSA